MLFDERLQNRRDPIPLHTRQIAGHLKEFFEPALWTVALRFGRVASDNEVGGHLEYVRQPGDTLGRAVMREADQHAWCERLKKECGWSDGGRAMLARVQKRPARTVARWHWLLQTDGLRFDPWDHDEYYEDSPCWKTMRAKWDREQSREASSDNV